MKLTKITILALSACVGLLGCDELKGTFTATRSITVVDKKGKTLVVPNGTYSTNFKYKEDEKVMELKLKKAQGDKDVDLKIRIPAGKEIPKESGSVHILGSEIGQSFDIKGEVGTSTHETERYRFRDSCTYNERVVICEPVCRDYYDRWGRRHRECRDECHERYITRYGTRDIEYHDVITRTGLDAQFLESNSQESLARFVVGQETQTRVYDYYGECYRN